MKNITAEPFNSPVRFKSLVHVIALPACTSSIIKPQLVIGPPTRVFDPTPLIKREPRHLERRGFRLSAALELFHFARQLRRNAFICVQAEDPVVRSLMSGKVLLSRITRPRPDKDVIGEGASDLDCAIGALGIHDDYLVGPRQRFESCGNVVLFVESNDCRGYFHLSRAYFV